MSPLIPFILVSSFVLLSVSAVSNGRWLVALAWLAAAAWIVVVEERRLLERAMRLLRRQ